MLGEMGCVGMRGSVKSHLCTSLIGFDCLLEYIQALALSLEDHHKLLKQFCHCMHISCSPWNDDCQVDRVISAACGAVAHWNGNCFEPGKPTVAGRFVALKNGRDRAMDNNAAFFRGGTRDPACQRSQGA